MDGRNHDTGKVVSVMNGERNIACMDDEAEILDYLLKGREEQVCGPGRNPQEASKHRLLSEASRKLNIGRDLQKAGLLDDGIRYLKMSATLFQEAIPLETDSGNAELMRRKSATWQRHVDRMIFDRANSKVEDMNGRDNNVVNTTPEPSEKQVAPSPTLNVIRKTDIDPRWYASGLRLAQRTVCSHTVRTALVIGLLALVVLVQLCQTLNFKSRAPAAPAHSLLGISKPDLPLKDIPRRLRSFQHCSIDTLRKDTNLDFLETAKPLEVLEYESRRNRLARALHAEGLDAFMVEPGYTLQYYANVNQPKWEVWEPEERPFVMVVRPWLTNSGVIVANTSFLVPTFEAERARLLGMPFEDEPNWITYEEHWNPYATLIDSAVFGSCRWRTPKIMVDEEMRDFISRGLVSNGFEVNGLGGEVERVRQIKSEAEIGILRAVNTGTVEAVRAMRKCMKLKYALSEDDVMKVLDNTMRSAGLDPFFDIVLFDEDASNPHGGTDGTKILETETMVLIDVGAHLYGYSSDICRSFFGPWLSPPKDEAEHEALSGDMKEKLKVWDIVLEAQTASLHALHENSTAAAVDIAARDIITEAGYGKAFTHRVGHGIGIKAHESPYLNKGNVNTTLKAGMTFTSEPGIYLVDKFGIRHEDVLLVREQGLPELLTGQRARSPWEP